MRLLTLLLFSITFLFSMNEDKEIKNLIDQYGIVNFSHIIVKQYKKELPKKIDQFTTTIDIKSKDNTLYIIKEVNDSNDFVKFVLEDSSKWNKVKHYYILSDSLIACRNPITYTYLQEGGDYEVDYIRKSDKSLMFKIKIEKSDCNQFNKIPRKKQESKNLETIINYY